MGGPRHFLRSILCGLAAAAVASCGGDGDVFRTSGPTWSDSAGVRIVKNPPRGTWTDATQLGVARDLEIGVLDGQPEYIFGSIVDVEVDNDGRIYVLDRQFSNVRAYDREGVFLHSFGGPGSGPGELSPRAEAILTREAGDFLIPDVGHRRASLFQADGALLGEFQVPYPDWRPAEWAWAEAGDGSYLNHVVNHDWEGLLRYDGGRERVDSVIQFSQGRAINLDAPLWPVLPGVPVWAAAPDGRLLSGFSNRYRIEVRGAEGDLEMIILRDPEVELIPAADGEQFAHRAREAARAGLADDAPRDGTWERLYPRDAFVPADSAPLLMRLAAGHEGTIWVQRAPSLNLLSEEVLKAQHSWRGGTESPRWEVFSAEGVLLGEVVFPSRFALYRIKGTLIYGVERDEHDVQKVVRLRILTGTD